MSQKESFYYQIEFLSKYYKTVAFDFAGFGKSQTPKTAYSVGDYADWVIKLGNLLQIKKPHIVAHSFGARVAIKLLGEKNYSANKLVITGGAGIVKPRSLRYIRRVNAYKRIKKLFPRFAEKHFGSEEYKKLCPIMRKSYVKIVNEDLTLIAKNIAVPTLLIYGENDFTTPYLEEGVTFNKLIKNSKLFKMQGGHFCFCERYNIFNNHIYDFLKE